MKTTQPVGSCLQGPSSATLKLLSTHSRAGHNQLRTREPGLWLAEEEATGKPVGM